MNFLDDLHQHNTLLEKISKGSRLGSKEQELLSALREKYGLSEDGTVKTQEHLAECLGVTRRTIANWKKEGMPIEADGSYDPVRIALWNSAIFDDDDTGIISEKSHWDVEFRKFRALLAKAQYERETGSLISLDAVKELLTNRAVELKKSLLSLARRTALKLADKPLDEVQRILEEEVLEILRSYSRPSPLVDPKKEEVEND